MPAINFKTYLFVCVSALGALLKSFNVQRCHSYVNTYNKSVLWLCVFVFFFCSLVWSTNGNRTRNRYIQFSEYTLNVVIVIEHQFKDWIWHAESHILALPMACVWRVRFPRCHQPNDFSFLLIPIQILCSHLLPSRCQIVKQHSSLVCLFDGIRLNIDRLAYFLF